MWHLAWPLFAHVVGMRPPDLFSWIAAIALFGGLWGVLYFSQPLRLACVLLALAGLGATIDDWIVRAQRPAAPRIVVRLIAPPGRTTSPMVVRLCATLPSGRPTSPTADNRYMLIRLDGVQVAEIHQSTIMLSATPGRHQLFVEVNNSYHQEFQPRIAFQRTVTVTHKGFPHVPACPRR